MVNIILYGTGKTAKFLIEIIKGEPNLHLLCCIDSNPEKKGSTCNECLVDYAGNIHNYEYAYILIASVYKVEIYNTLIKQYGVNANKIVINSMHWINERIVQNAYEKYYQNNTRQPLKLQDEKIVIYTAIFGAYDTLKEPAFKEEGIDYICFTNNMNLKSKFWKIIYRKENSHDACRDAKIYKILPHKYLKEYDISIWVDASITIKKSLLCMLKSECGNCNINLFPHNMRTNIYDEAKECITGQLDDEDIIKNQIYKYKKEGFVQESGLISAGVMIRRHNQKDVVELMNAWWDEIENGSRRDQLSLPFCLWKIKTKYDLVNLDIFENAYFQVEKHLEKRK